MKEIKLEAGQVWQVPDKKWIRVRVIREISMLVKFLELGDSTGGDIIEKKAFRRWIRRNKAELWGMKDFKTGKVRVVK